MAALIGAGISLLGGLFFLLAGIGLLRMPDAFNRMQAGTKATTLGSILFLLGIGIAHGELLGRSLILIAFIVLTNPVSSNALARAAHIHRERIGARLGVDALAEASAAKAEAKEASATGGRT